MKQRLREEGKVKWSHRWRRGAWSWKPMGPRLVKEVQLWGFWDSMQCHSCLPKALPNVKAGTLGVLPERGNLSSMTVLGDPMTPGSSHQAPYRGKCCQTMPVVRCQASPQPWQCDPLATPHTPPGACRYELARSLTLRILVPAYLSLTGQTHTLAPQLNPSVPSTVTEICSGPSVKCKNDALAVRLERRT